MGEQFCICRCCHNYKAFGRSAPVIGGYYPVLCFCDTLFTANNSTKQDIQFGIVDVTGAKVQFSNSVSFVDNKGSALVARSVKIIVTEGTTTKFFNNRATYGGAMALYSYSVLELFPSTEIIFDSSELGGAVYARSPHFSDYSFYHKCFISYYNNSISPNNWNTSIVFSNNSAPYGHAVYVDTLTSCAKLSTDMSITSALHWTPFIYTGGPMNNTISTSPNHTDFTLPDHIAPGESIGIDIRSVDDLNQSIPSTYKITITKGRVTMTNPYVNNDGNIRLKGEPGTEFSLTIQTQGLRQVSVTKTGVLGDCPLGLTLENDTCVCSADTDERYVGISECDMTEFTAYLHDDLWLGCTRPNKHLVTSYCPSGYCSNSEAVSMGHVYRGSKNL